MSEHHEIKLSRRYEVPGTEPFDTIVLREPTFSDLYIAGLGRPVEFQPTKNGIIRVAYPEVIDQYVKRLAVSPEYQAIGQIAAVDAIRLESVVCDFFRDRTE